MVVEYQNRHRKPPPPRRPGGGRDQGAEAGLRDPARELRGADLPAGDGAEEGPGPRPHLRADLRGRYELEGPGEVQLRPRGQRRPPLPRRPGDLRLVDLDAEGKEAVESAKLDRREKYDAIRRLDRYVGGDLEERPNDMIRNR